MEILKYILNQGLLFYTISIFILALALFTFSLYKIIKKYWNSIKSIIDKIDNACDKIDTFNFKMNAWESFAGKVIDARRRIDKIEIDLDWIKKVCDRRQNNISVDNDRRGNDGR